jgi:hypothetical protein
MTWTKKDAFRYSRAVDTAEKAQRWAKVANDARARDRGLHDHQAIREANAAVGMASTEPPPPFVLGTEPQRRVK